MWHYLIKDLWSFIFVYTNGIFKDLLHDDWLHNPMKLYFLTIECKLKYLMKSWSHHYLSENFCKCIECSLLFLVAFKFLNKIWKVCVANCLYSGITQISLISDARVEGGRFSHIPAILCNSKRECFQSISWSYLFKYKRLTWSKTIFI